MAFVGIDFSLNSPAACVLDGENYHFVSFFNYGKKWKKPVTKAFAFHEELIEIGAITGIPYTREVGTKDFLLREREKMTDADKIAQIIDAHLSDGYAVQAFALEGFSYGSSGNSFIDMIQYNVHLRKRLIDSYGIEAFHIFQPAAVKKLAGKGNANKEYMFEAFKSNAVGDKTLEKSSFWKWCRERSFEKVPKPVDDLVDSYFILQGLLSNIIPLSQTP